MIYKGWSYRELWDMTDEEREYWINFANDWNQKINDEMKKGK